MPLQAKLDSSAPALQAKWDSIEDKGSVVGLGLTALLALYVGTGVLDRLDRIPLVRRCKHLPQWSALLGDVDFGFYLSAAERVA